ncbi:MAG: apolipoprotein N-acyltransferase [Acidimicrobiales bacterium]
MAIAAGVLVALSLPPFGWWPLGVVGVGAFAAVLPGRGPLARTFLGAMLGLGQYGIGLWWVGEFNQGGYVALLLLAMLFTAVAAVAVPARRPAGVLVGLPAALMVTDWIRGHFPFGGLPLGGIPLGQAAGPLVPVARLGGPLLVTGVTAAMGAALAVVGGALVGRCGRVRMRQAFGGVVGLAVLLALVVVGRFGPDGSGGGPEQTITVAAVQGGGPRGLHQSQVDPSVAFQRQLAASLSLHPPLALVVWPEDVISVEQPIDQTPEAVTMGQLARSLRATVVAGVVEDVGATQFRNAAVAWSPQGVIVARYDKVHRVPFGEYIPDRSFFEHLANLDLVPRDAIAGHGPGLLDTPAAPLGTVISYEVFFEDRGRSAIGAGGELLIVPTNASSYATSQVPTQEVAAAQLQAWATGRDVVQAAPTGYSALIDHDGHILRRSTLGHQQALTGVLTLRTGRTIFVRVGDLPVLAIAAVALVASAVLERRHR